MSLSDTHLEILSTHYSDTFSLIKAAVEKRDRLFIYTLILIFILLFYMNTPATFSELISSFVNNQAGKDAVQNNSSLVDTSFISTILNLGLLALSHTYFQTVLHVERQYKYIYQLEEGLSKNFSEKAFTREGKHYERNQRTFSVWTKAIFWYLSPLLFLYFNVSWWRFLFAEVNVTTLYKMANGLIALGIFISLVLYLWALIKEK